MSRTGAVVVALGLLAGCGWGDDGDKVATTTDARWEREHLPGELGPDYVTQLAAAGDQLVVVGAADDGSLHAFVASDSGSFQAGAPADLSLGYPGIGGVAWLSGRWVALGGTKERGGERRSTFAVQVLESGDGEQWEVVDASGFEDPAEVAGLVALDGGLVAGGTLRLDDPSSGGFRPAAWTSRDGRSWTQTALPMGSAREGAVTDVAAVGGTAFATGRLDDRGVLWSSPDRGVSWTVADGAGLPEVSSVGGIAVVGDVIVLSAWMSTPELGEEGEHGRGLLLRSTDAGAHWSAATTPPPGRSGGYAIPVHAAGGYFLVVDGEGRSAEPSIEDCYADIERCRARARRGPGASLYASTDGDRWTRVDARGIDGGPRFDAFGSTADGRIVALQPSLGGTDAWIWPAGEPLAMRDADPEPPPPEVDVDVIDPEAPMVAGRRYAMPLYVHCGMGWLGADGRTWQLVGPDPGGDDGYPARWPLVGESLYGFVTLVAPDTVEYSIGPDEVVATYEPATTTPPGCE